MNTKTVAVAIASAVMALAMWSTADAGDRGLEKTLRQVMTKGLAAYDREDVTETLRYVHTKSPEYAEMKKRLSGQFERLDLTTTLVHFRYIGHDDEFAVARVKLKTTAPAGTDFEDNVMDTITLFHMEDGTWKFWSDHIIGVQLVE